MVKCPRKKSSALFAHPLDPLPLKQGLFCTPDFYEKFAFLWYHAYMKNKNLKRAEIAKQNQNVI